LIHKSIIAIAFFSVTLAACGNSEVTEVSEVSQLENKIAYVEGGQALDFYDQQTELCSLYGQLEDAYAAMSEAEKATQARRTGDRSCAYVESADRVGEAAMEAKDALENYYGQ